MRKAIGLWELAVRLSYYLAPGLVFLSIWCPVIRHYRVPDVTITDDMVARAIASPADEVLDKLKGFRLIDRKWADDAHLLLSAEQLLKGEVQIPNIPVTTIRMPFDANDIDRGPISWQLSMAGFLVPDVLLRAYKISGRDEFLLTARDVILGWASYERSAWLPRGLLWNDHAIAARVAVLAEFWRLYRHRPDYQLQVAKTILHLADRSAQLLPRPSHFTFATNHGIMQNLALWHLRLAFPTLPQTERYQRLAVTRMQEQMGFYVNPEGVVLEHSAGYQDFGLELISHAFRHLTLLKEPIPSDWSVKYEQAEAFYAQLKRPDGSLPMFGDTDGSTYPRGSFARRVDAEWDWKPDRVNALYPDAGYSVWWDGLENWPNPQRMSQTVVTWSFFPGHGHKHADEMSVLLWAGGQTWWTNSGYWPYGVDGRSAAESWSGSNAPHLVNEPAESLRHTRLLFYGSSQHLALIELERTGPRRYVARRQVVQWKPHLWLVIDGTSGDDSDRTTTTWTTFPNVSLRKSNMDVAYRLQAGQTTLTLAAFILGSRDMTVKEVTGSLTPFAGWAMINVPRPAPALVVEQPANNGWSVAIWSLEDGRDSPNRLVGTPHNFRWGGTDDWGVTLPTASGGVEIRRQGSEVFLAHGTKVGRIESLTLTKASNSTDAFDRISASYNATAKKYPGFRESLAFRIKITYLLIAILVLQEIFFWGYRRLVGRHYLALRIFNACGWAGVGTWLHFAYFRPLW